MTFLDAYCARCSGMYEKNLRDLAKADDEAKKRLKVYLRKPYYDKLYEVFGLSIAQSLNERSAHFLVRDFLPTAVHIRRFLLSPSRALVRSLIGHEVPALDNSHTQHIWALNCPSGLLFAGDCEIRGVIYHAVANQLVVFLQDPETKLVSPQVTEIKKCVQHVFPELAMEEVTRTQLLRLMHAFIIYFSCERSLRQFVSSAPLPKDKNDRRKPTGKYSLFRPVALEMAEKHGAFQTPTHDGRCYFLDRQISASGHLFIEPCGEEKQKLMWSRS